MPKEPIVLFAGGDDGAGFALNVGANGYHWAVNWDPRSPGSSCPAAIPAVRWQNTGEGPIFGGIEWFNANGEPIVIYVTGDGAAEGYVVTIDSNGIDQTVPTAAAPTKSFTDAVLYRNDGSDADAEVVWICNGSANDPLYELLKDGTIRNTGHTQKADKLGVVGGDLWCATADYKMQRCTTDADPGLSGSWGTAIPCGLPTWKINKILALGNSPVVLKPEGVFIYDAQIDEFVNLTSFVTPHPDNGKAGIVDGRGRVYYDTVDGDLIVITFGYQSQQAPSRSYTIHRETPGGRISKMTVDAQQVYIATTPGQIKTQMATAAPTGVGMQVFSEDGGVFTNHNTTGINPATPCVIDGRQDTYADWSLLSDVAPDFIWVGADEPFLAIGFELYAPRTTDQGRTSEMRVRYGEAGGYEPIEQASSPSFHGSVDGTLKFSKSGLITIQSRVTDPNFQDLTALASKPWIKTTVNSVEKYWIRITPPSSTALTGLKVKEVYVVPYRPGLDGKLPIAQQKFGISAYAMSGVLPKIMVGSWEGEAIKWHDVWTLNSSEVLALVVSQLSATPQESRRNLIIVTHEFGMAIPVGYDGHPARRPFTALEYVDNISFTIGTYYDREHLIAFSGRSLPGAETHKWRCNGVSVLADNVQSGDEVWLWYWWDGDADRVHRHGPYNESQFMTPPLEGEGRVLYTVLGYEAGEVQYPVTPQFYRVEIPADAWEDLGPIHSFEHADWQSPQVR